MKSSLVDEVQIHKRWTRTSERGCYIRALDRLGIDFVTRLADKLRIAQTLKPDIPGILFDNTGYIT